LKTHQVEETSHKRHMISFYEIFRIDKSVEKEIIF
jgi:hypothetical protein